MNVAEYLRRKDAVHNTTFIINAQGGFYQVGDKLIPMREFEAQHQTPISLITFRGKMISEKRGEDIDGRNTWMNVK
jgi:hypothetical protein